MHHTAQAGLASICLFSKLRRLLELSARYARLDGEFLTVDGKANPRPIICLHMPFKIAYQASDGILLGLTTFIDQRHELYTHFVF